MIRAINELKAQPEPEKTTLLEGTLFNPKEASAMSSDEAVKQLEKRGWREVKSKKTTPSTSTNDVVKIVQQNFGKQTKNALRTLQGENARYRFDAENVNRNGSIDRGLFQINSDTYNDFVRRRPELLQRAGISSWDDMFDPMLNARMARIIWDAQGWAAWYGAPPDLRGRFATF